MDRLERVSLLAGHSIQLTPTLLFLFVNRRRKMWFYIESHCSYEFFALGRRRGMGRSYKLGLNGRFHFDLRLLFRQSKFDFYQEGLTVFKSGCVV